jgi:hypothetical protein
MSSHHELAKTNLELLKASFERNCDIYHSHHIHLTLDPETPLTEEHKSKCTRIILPFFGPNGEPSYRRQVLTSIKVANREQFYRELALWEPLIDRVLGWKLEGVVTKYTPRRSDIKDFCYYEEHWSTMENPGHDAENYWSFSIKNGKYIAASRTYDKEAVPTRAKYELCYIDNWPVLDVEGEWKRAVGSHGELFASIDMPTLSKDTWAN